MTAGGSIVFDRIADSYDATRGGLERGRAVAPVLDELLPAGPLLEVGVGTGLVAAALAERGRAVVGVDLSVPMLARAAARVPGRVAVGDAHRLPVGTAALDGAYLVHVLHLVGDMGATLAELRRVLRPGGTLVATVRPDLPAQRDDLVDLMNELHAAFALGDRPDREDAVSAAAGAHGFTPVDRRTITRPGVQATPREVADGVRARSWSWMWAIPADDAWHRIADPVVERLRALPDQDRPRGGAATSPVLAFRRT